MWGARGVESFGVGAEGARLALVSLWGAGSARGVGVVGGAGVVAKVSARVGVRSAGLARVSLCDGGIGAGGTEIGAWVGVEGVEGAEIGVRGVEMARAA